MRLRNALWQSLESVFGCVALESELDDFLSELYKRGYVIKWVKVNSIKKGEK